MSNMPFTVKGVKNGPDCIGEGSKCVLVDWGLRLAACKLLCFGRRVLHAQTIELHAWSIKTRVAINIGIVEENSSSHDMILRSVDCDKPITHCAVKTQCCPDVIMIALIHSLVL